MENKSLKYDYNVGDKVIVIDGNKSFITEIIAKYGIVGFGCIFDGKRLFDKEIITFNENDIYKRILKENESIEGLEKIEKVEEKKYLKTWEAIKALEEGYNIKHKDWIYNQYIYKNKEGQIISNRVGPVEIDNLNNEWEIYEETKKEIPKEFEGLKYILGSINNMDCDNKDCDECPLGMDKCNMLDEIFFDMKEKYNF